MSQTIVLKFGGAAVATPQSFLKIAKIISYHKLKSQRVVVVVSAMGNSTNELIQLAHQVNENPPQRELDMLISVGERISIALLAMALEKMKIKAVSFTGSQSGIITTADHFDAKIIDVKPKRLLPELEKGTIVIVAGFQGMGVHGDITTLGRGGSDTTAVALAVALGADTVVFYKDVDGVFNCDPKENENALRYEKMSYEEALAIVKKGARILHSRCLDIAQKNAIPLIVRNFKSEDEEKIGTLIGDTQKEKPENKKYE